MQSGHAADAPGPAGPRMVGTASAVKAVRSAEAVIAAMKACGREPAWSAGTSAMGSAGTDSRVVAGPPCRL